MRAGQIIALCVIGLLTIGVLMVNSADMRIQGVSDPQAGLPPTPVASILFSRASLYMVLALSAMTAAAFIPVRRLAKLAECGPDEGLRLVVLGSLCLIAVCALVYIPGLSRAMNGSRRWIEISGLSVQPSEIAKWGMVVLVALYGASRAAMIHEFWRGLVPALVSLGVVVGLIVLEDLGTGVLILSVACVVLIAAGARLRYFMLAVPVGAAGIVAAIITSPYRVKRILAFLDPYADPKGIGYHTIQSLLAIANGGGFGRGLGHGLQKFGYLPERRTDFIFAVICEELGVAGAALVMALFAAIVWTGFAIMRRESNAMLRLVVLGVIATLGMQAVMNLLVVTGMAPTKGIALPLLSYGGTGWILTSFSLGLVIAIDRTQPEAMAAAPEVEPTEVETPEAESPATTVGAA
jgi:cell division protein FtsW